jgi:Xaa-Pro aminopeptidase
MINSHDTISENKTFPDSQRISLCFKKGVFMSSLIIDKVQQAIKILNEQNVDLWLTYVRETKLGNDPVLPMIYGADLTWRSVLIITRSGETIAIVGSLEAETARGCGAYQTVIPYTQSIRLALQDTLEKIKPRQIAINYSRDDIVADGLHYGLYLDLMDLLAGTPFVGKLISAENIIRALRGRKLPGEVDRIRKAIETTRLIYEETFAYIHPGLTELQVSEFMHSELIKYAVAPAWDLAGCPSVNAGPASAMGHSGPADIVIQPGHIVHFDFGVQQDEYCSDIQRLLYFLAPGEAQPPEAVLHGFNTAVRSIQAAIRTMKPGVLGWRVDQAARQVVVEAGYPEFPHAIGHQLGRAAHDGAGLLAPKWERYGNSPDYPIEIGQVYTVEPSLMVPGYGVVGLEEDILITEDGPIYLSDPQIELIIK